MLALFCFVFFFYFWTTLVHGRFDDSSHFVHFIETYYVWATVVLVFYRPSARSYLTDISRLAEILPKVRSGVAHCVKLLKNLNRFAEYIFRK